MTIVTRLCLDELTAARAEREQYTGPWLPGPVVAPGDRPDTDVEREHDLSSAPLALLERLRSIERAVYVLREALDRPYAEVARRVDRTEAHCRKIAQRARDRIGAKVDAIDASPPAHAELLDRFVEALETTRDPEVLTAVLAEDVTHVTDGGEVKDAAKWPIEGLEWMVRFLLSISAKAPDALRVRPVHVNDRPGLLALEGDRVHSVWCFRVADGRIQDLYCVRNPETLQHLGRPPVNGPDRSPR